MLELQLSENTFPTDAFEKELAALIAKHGIFVKFELPPALVASALCSQLAALYIHTLNVKDNAEPDEERKREILGN